jgi:hypothetical protein
MSAINDTVSLPKGWVNERAMRQAVWPENPWFYSSVALRVQCRKGRFPHLRITNRYYFRIADVLEFLRRHSVTAEEASAARPPHGNLRKGKKTKPLLNS